MEFNEFFNNQSNLRNMNKSVRNDGANKKNTGELEKAKQRGNFILRQELSDFTPECNIMCSIYFDIALFFLLILFSIPLIMSSNSTGEHIHRYDYW